MNTYSYILEDSSKADVIIHEFIAADTIQDAYKKVINVINDLNAIDTEYIWQIRNIENSYFVGIMNHCEHDIHNCICECDNEHNNLEDLQEIACECCK